MISIYTFEKEGKNTRILLELDFKAKSLIARIFQSVIRKMLMKLIHKGIEKIESHQ